MEKNGKKTTVIVENGVKERHGNMAYYNKTTEKTSIGGKIAGMDVTSVVLTSKELGLYQSYNPTGFAPVTNQVREFDWGKSENISPLVVGAGTAAGLIIAAPYIAGLAAASAAYGTYVATTAAIAAITLLIKEIGDDDGSDKSK